MNFRKCTHLCNLNPCGNMGHHHLPEVPVPFPSQSLPHLCPPKQSLFLNFPSLINCSVLKLYINVIIIVSPLCVTSFTQRNVSETFPGCSMHQPSPSDCWVVFQRRKHGTAVHSLVSQWTWKSLMPD